MDRKLSNVILMSLLGSSLLINQTDANKKRSFLKGVGAGLLLNSLRPPKAIIPLPMPGK